MLPVFQLLNDGLFLDNRDYAHGATAFRTQQRVYFIDFLDKSRPVSAELLFTRQRLFDFWRGRVSFLFLAFSPGGI